MKPALYFAFLYTLLTACSSDKKSAKQIKAIDFAYFDISPEAFSLRISQQDSLFIKQYFSSDTEGQLKDSITYFGLLKGDLKQQFDSIIAVLDFSKLDSAYESGHIDGDEYRLYIEGDTSTKQIYVHSVRPPKELESLKAIYKNEKEFNFRTC